MNSKNIPYEKNIMNLCKTINMFDKLLIIKGSCILPNNHLHGKHF